MQNLKKGTQNLISIEKLYPSPLNTYPIKDIDEMIGSIKACKLITPLTVIGPDADGRYEILSGERRFTALQSIYEETGEYAEVPCYVIGDINTGEFEKKLTIESANIETRDFNKNERVFNIIRILKDMKGDEKYKTSTLIRDLEEYIGLSERYRRAYVTVFNNAGDELIEAINNSNIRIMDGATLSLLEEDEQEEAVERINSGEKAKDIIDDFKNKKALEQAQKQAERELMAMENIDDMSLNDVLGILDDSDISMNGIATDTTHLLKGLTKDGSNSNDLNVVVRWCKKMIGKTEYTPEETDALISVLSLAEHINAYTDLQIA